MTSIPHACNKLPQSAATISWGCVGDRFEPSYLLSSNWKLDALVSLDPSLDIGADGIDGGKQHGGEDETEEEVKGGVSDLNTDDLDVQLSGTGRVPEGSDVTVLVVTTDLAQFGGRVDDRLRLLKGNMRLI